MKLNSSIRFKRGFCLSQCSAASEFQSNDSATSNGNSTNGPAAIMPDSTIEMCWRRGVVASAGFRPVGRHTECPDTRSHGQFNARQATLISNDYRCSEYRSRWVS
jgi:hypothetical protein